jgi:hypothetical protein
MQGLGRSACEAHDDACARCGRLAAVVQVWSTRSTSAGVTQISKVNISLAAANMSLTYEVDYSRAYMRSYLEAETWRAYLLHCGRYGRSALSLVGAVIQTASRKAARMRSALQLPALRGCTGSTCEDGSPQDEIVRGAPGRAPTMC